MTNAADFRLSLRALVQHFRRQGLSELEIADELATAMISVRAHTNQIPEA